MAQTFTLRGINIGVRKTFADIAKVFGMANVIPYSTIYYTIEHRTIKHIARKFIADKGEKLHHDAVLSTS